MERKAYLLTTNEFSERTIFSKSVLERVGFTVILFNAIYDKNPLLSHRKSYLKICEEIANSSNGWYYVFEDDINILEEIKLDEIIQYESISTNVFYLGICKYGKNTLKNTGIKINDKDVFEISDNVRGLHAVAYSNKGAKDFLNFSENYKTYEYIDMILELYTIKNPAIVVRSDLESYISGHYGIFFQDRNKFPSTI